MILAMNMGGDDFVVKPFDLNFLLAKINSLLRRTYDFQGAMNVVACGDVVLDLDNAKLQYKGRILELSRNDFIILKELMTHSGKSVSRDELMQALWNDNTFVDDNTLTGALDSRSSAQVMKMFTDIHRTGQTILVVTHSVKTACYAGRVLFIRDGRLFNQLYRGDMDNEAFQEK
ncbi:MAG: hypothetical protein HFJ08_18605, partial [Lachnospiraceae bacterium]|nr:hypothetical protein [Lachnospiraceae bacterium]